MDQQRRRVLELIGCSGLAAIAGCTSSDTGNMTTPSDTTDTNANHSPTPDSSSSTSTQENTSATTEYQQWLVAPNEFAGRAHYFFNVFDYEQLRSVRSRLSEDVFSRLQSNVRMEDFAEFNLDLDEISEVIMLRPMSGPSGAWNVVLGDFSKERVTEAFAESNMSTASRGGYTLYFGGGVDGAVGVADGVILLGTSEEMDSTANVESLIDARAGEANRYATQNGNMAAVMDELGDATFVGGTTSERVTETSLQSGLFDGQVGYGYADTVRGEIMDTKEVFVFETRADVDMTEMDEYTDIELYDDFTTISPSQNGRLVLVTGEVATAAVYG